MRYRGATLGRDVRFGVRCVVRRPWCLSAGEQCEFEHQVYIKAVAAARVHFGNRVFVGCNAEFDISTELWVGDDVLIAPGCFITDHSHGRAVGLPMAVQDCEASAVRIEDDVWIGANAVILPGVTIASGAIVAAGAVVHRNVAAMDIVGGVPARVIGNRRD